MKKLFFSSLVFLFGIFFAQAKTSNELSDLKSEELASSGSIQVALLLDTSSSMDGLINQAKARIWTIVNTMTTLRYNGKAPQIEIALYEYGNSGLSRESDYIRQVVGLTNDLDLISEHLFALRTNGGLEYCGAVIKDATNKLDWNADKNAMKLIYIAGNEPFDQGSVSYKEAIADAVKKGIFINTIFCGNNQEGIRTHWKDGADRGNGKYFYINSDARVRYISTPYDDQITICNQRLNGTYIGYGSYGMNRKKLQSVQDEEAMEISTANYADRAVAKAGAVYRNESWDLVDRVNTDPEALSKLKNEELPEELRGKSKVQLEAYVNAKAKERQQIQKEIADLAIKRQAYIDDKQAKEGTQDDLGNAIVSSIQEIAKLKGFRGI